MSREPNATGCNLSGGGLYRSIVKHGCPMIDETPGEQSLTGEFFKFTDGIETAMFWLPCVSSPDKYLPGTCEACEDRQAIAKRVDDASP
jgi:hypothetical protein